MLTTDCIPGLVISSTQAVHNAEQMALKKAFDNKPKQNSCLHGIFLRLTLSSNVSCSLECPTKELRLAVYNGKSVPSSYTSMVVAFEVQVI